MAVHGSAMNNPMINKLARMDRDGEFAGTERTATYGGIALKTIFFLLMTAAGVGLYFLNPVREQGNTIFLVTLILTGVTPFLAWLIKPLTAVFGIIYSISQGYVICWASVTYAAEYQGIIFAAVAITLVIILVMLFLYTTGIVKVGHRFKAVIGTLFLTSVVGSIGVFISGIVAPNNIIIQLVRDQGGVFAIVMALIGVLIAALFLLSDFDTIQHTVDDHLPRKYEWMAAFGLIITVLWLYLKVLNLIASITQKGKNGTGGPATPAA